MDRLKVKMQYLGKLHAWKVFGLGTPRTTLGASEDLMVRVSSDRKRVSEVVHMLRKCHISSIRERDAAQRRHDEAEPEPAPSFFHIHAKTNQKTPFNATDNALIADARAAGAILACATKITEEAWAVLLRKPALSTAWSPGGRRSWAGP